MKTRSKTPLFLMELIIMLLVFSVSAAICLQVFAGARRISDDSRRLEAAVLHAQTVAECWKASHGDPDQTAERMGTFYDGEHFVVFDEENSLHTEFSCKDATAYIVVLQGEKEIFSLECEAVMTND